MANAAAQWPQPGRAALAISVGRYAHRYPSAGVAVAAFRRGCLGDRDGLAGSRRGMDSHTHSPPCGGLWRTSSQVCRSVQLGSRHSPSGTLDRTRRTACFSRLRLRQVHRDHVDQPVARPEYVDRRCRAEMAALRDPTTRQPRDIDRSASLGRPSHHGRYCSTRTTRCGAPQSMSLRGPTVRTERGDVSILSVDPSDPASIVTW